MIITFNGDHGSGKSTIAKKIADDLDYEYYYTGNIFRSMAKDRGLTYAEFLELMDQDSSIDKEVDDRTVQLGKTKDNFVFDSRLAWHMIPQSLKIILTVNEEEAAKRILKHFKQEHSKERANEDKNFQTAEDIIASNRKRKEKDDKRYKELYNVDIWDQGNYDIVLDTTDLNIGEVHQKILELIKQKLQ